MTDQEATELVEMACAPKQLTRFDYTVSVEAETQEDADKVISARIDHDEDLREDGVDRYSICARGSQAYEPDHSDVLHAFGEAPQV